MRTALTGHLCHETIDQALDHGGEGGPSRMLTTKLRTGRPVRKRRRSPIARRILAAWPWSTTVPGIGDWGAIRSWAIQSLGDRHPWSRSAGYLQLQHLPDGQSAEQLRFAKLPASTGLPAPARQTLAWDRGSEMACNDLLVE